MVWNETPLHYGLSGDEPPLDERTQRRPGRRRISRRWLLGTSMTGLVATGLVGGALHAAFDGRSRLTQAPSLAIASGFSTGKSLARRGDRPLVALAPAPQREKIMNVPTVVREGDAFVIRKRPFAWAAAPLAVAASASYAPFDALKIYRTSRSDAVVSRGRLYGADVEAPVVTRREPFPLDANLTDRSISVREAARAVAAARGALDQGAAHMAALPYLTPNPSPRSAADPFALLEGPATLAVPPTAIPPTVLTLGSQNVSKVERIDTAQPGLDEPVAREEIVTVTAKSLLPKLEDVLARYDAEPDFARALSEASSLGFRDRRSATLRIAYHLHAGDDGAKRKVRRVSLYRGRDHVASLARDDDGAIVSAPEPASVEFGADDERRVPLSPSMPSLYDGLMRAALSQGLTEGQAQQLVRMMAFDLNLRAKATPADTLEVFYEPEARGRAVNDAAIAQNRILYASATVAGTTRRYYAHADAKGRVDFYNEKGRSSRAFLLRKPVPNGRFTSGFGMRRHPIARYRRMHTGVDWAAKPGTPILAAGNGTILKAGWAGGYGRQVKIRHANGYVTSYSHLRRFAKGIRTGQRVRQGQVIGQVGSSGASTGPHLHYEVIVNKRKVNPMRIRVPKGRSLSGAELARFERERERIDALVSRAKGEPEATVAAR